MYHPYPVPSMRLFTASVDGGLSDDAYSLVLNGPVVEAEQFAPERRQCRRLVVWVQHGHQVRHHLAALGGPGGDARVMTRHLVDVPLQDLREVLKPTDG